MSGSFTEASHENSGGRLERNLRGGLRLCKRHEDKGNYQWLKHICSFTSYCGPPMGTTTMFDPLIGNGAPVLRALGTVPGKLVVE